MKREVMVRKSWFVFESAKREEARVRSRRRPGNFNAIEELARGYFRQVLLAPFPRDVFRPKKN